MEDSVHEMFEGTCPRDFPRHCLTVVTDEVSAPAGFSSMWHCLDGSVPIEEVPWLRPDKLVEMACILLVTDVANPTQLEISKWLMHYADMHAEAPPIFALPMPCGADRKKRKDAAKELIKCGLDDIITGEPKGWKLAFELHGHLARSVQRSERMECLSLRLQRKNDEFAVLEQSIEVSLWQWVPTRLRMAIPPVDRYVEAHDAEGRLLVGGYKVGESLGGGLSARIFECEPPQGMPPAVPQGEVLRVVRKSNIKHVCDLVSLHRSCQVLRMLSTDWRHPNIVTVFAMYHSPTNIYFRMECVGPENFFQRLLARDKSQRRLSENQMCMMSQQVASAIDHMHNGPRICHRDIKPENVVVASEGRDGKDEIVVKLIDFDFAVQLRGSRCRASCGTFPFVAPEVVESEYDGMAADMWSTGVLMLEVACGVRILERKLSETGWSHNETNTGGPPMEAVHRLSSVLSDQGWIQNIVVNDCVSELSQASHWYAPIVCDLIKIVHTERLTSSKLVERLGRQSRQDL